MYSKIIYPLLILFIFFGTINTTSAQTKANNTVKEVISRGEIDKIKCDQVVSDTLHLGDTFTFYVDFTADNKAAKINDINYWFWSDQDYNGSDDMFQLHPTKEIEKENWIVKNKKLRLVESNDYTIRSLPSEPSEENILFKAEIIFQEIMPDGSLSKPEHLVRCVRANVKK